jgi:8-oxo-dGTP pyrophosphatase MutT (NUDIX family)
VLLDDGGRTLLFRGGDPAHPEDGTWWFTPGGGIEPGESVEQAALRELEEETGLVGVELGPLVAQRRVVFGFDGGWYDSAASFFVAHVARCDVRPTLVTEIEARSVVEHRWLDATALAALAEPVYPRELIGALPELLARRYPATPWEWAT